MTVDAAIGLDVQRRAKDRCEYCRMHQSLQGATFHVEHIIPRSQGGESILKNLAWACPSCNLHKSDRTLLVDSEGGQVKVFNPRADNWSEHFTWDDFSIVGLTEIGKALIEAFNLNVERKLKIRQAEKMFDLFPPQD